MITRESLERSRADALHRTHQTGAVYIGDCIRYAADRIAQAIIVGREDEPLLRYHGRARCVDCQAADIPICSHPHTLDYDPTRREAVTPNGEEPADG